MAFAFGSNRVRKGFILTLKKGVPKWTQTRIVDTFSQWVWQCGSGKRRNLSVWLNHPAKQTERKE